MSRRVENDQARVISMIKRERAPHCHLLANTLLRVRLPLGRSNPLSFTKEKSNIPLHTRASLSHRGACSMLATKNFRLLSLVMLEYGGKKMDLIWLAFNLQ
jgi:hypothetical protein